jgi:hypothetical protein
VPLLVDGAQPGLLVQILAGKWGVKDSALVEDLIETATATTPALGLVDVQNFCVLHRCPTPLQKQGAHNRAPLKTF